MARNVNLDEAKRDKHLKAVQNYINFVDDWRYKRIKFVKARYNEMQSAISFIRNQALNSTNSQFLFAPMCRNVAGVLRHTLHNHEQESNDRLSTMISQDIFTLAEIYLCFPFDDSDFVCFLSNPIYTDNRADLDNYNLMLENAGKYLDIMDFIDAINKKAKWIWENFKTPHKWQIPYEVWYEQIDNISKKLYYQNIKSFHDK